MMYSEFIEHSNFTEQYISYAEYTTYIEPIYMAADQIPTKQEFIAMLRDAFTDLLQWMMVLSISSIIQELVLMEEKDTVFSKRKKLLSLI